MLKIVFYILAVIVAVLISVLLSVFLTGRVKRSYPVLSGETKIEIDRFFDTVDNFANKYRPIMYKQATVETPPILWVWYNAVDNGESVDFVYYNVWENEISPNTTIHRYYSFFRAFYYGYPLYDIEYVQVSVTKRDGRVKSVMFETGPSNDYYSVFNEHIVLKATYGKKDYLVNLTDRDSKESISSYNDTPQFQNLNIKLGVQTWNHLSVLLLPSNSSFYVEEVPYRSLKFLSNEDYAGYKFARKSQGDHVTKENKLGVAFSAIAIFVFVTIPSKLLSIRKK